MGAQRIVVEECATQAEVVAEFSRALHGATPHEIPGTIPAELLRDDPFAAFELARNGPGGIAASFETLAVTTDGPVDVAVDVLDADTVVVSFQGCSRAFALHLLECATRF